MDSNKDIKSRKEYFQTYYQLNKESIREQQTKYQEDKKEYFQTYYRLNKEKILENCKTKTTCECGSIITKKYLKKHLKTHLHQERLISKVSPKPPKPPHENPSECHVS